MLYRQTVARLASDRVTSALPRPPASGWRERGGLDGPVEPVSRLAAQECCSPLTPAVMVWLPFVGLPANSRTLSFGPLTHVRPAPSSTEVSNPLRQTRLAAGTLHASPHHREPSPPSSSDPLRQLPRKGVAITALSTATSTIPAPSTIDLAMRSRARQSHLIRLSTPASRPTRPRRGDVPLPGVSTGAAGPALGPTHRPGFTLPTRSTRFHVFAAGRPLSRRPRQLHPTCGCTRTSRSGELDHPSPFGGPGVWAARLGRAPHRVGAMLR